MSLFRKVPALFLGVLFLALMQSPTSFAKDAKAAKKEIRALNDKIMAANEKGDLQGALTAAEGAYQLAKDTWGENALETANAMNNMANLYTAANEAPAAEQFFKRAILIYIEKSDPNGTGMADIYFNLGVAYAMQKKYSDAINILSKAEVIRHEKLGPENPDTQKVGEMIGELRKLANMKTERI